jgi:peptidoglycan/xylan/chitin deacetylase (PgdA/CDA1 family)
VSLSFDDGTKNHYTLVFLKGLRPRGMRATFYITTSRTNTDGSLMSWAQLNTLARSGQEIGGHTYHHLNLPKITDKKEKLQEICLDRQNLLNHGLDPVTFAYPEGAYDTEVQHMVRSCGYTAARAAGGINIAGVGAGPVYAESIPPADPYAIRTVYSPPSGAANTSPTMQAAVTAAAQHGGGWIVLNFHLVCSRVYDPNNYDACMSFYESIDLETLTGFLDWLQHAGQPGGAPAGTVVKTIRQVITGS